MNTVSLAFKFGGQNYNFTGIDLILDDVSTTPGLQGMCLSSLFVLGSVLDSGIIGGSGPAWLVGDAFLKSVYSVFRSVDVPFIHTATPLSKTCPRYETSVTGAITGSVGFARLSGVDGRLSTNGATMFSTQTSTSGLNIPTTSGIPTSLAPIPNPNANNGNGTSSGRLRSRVSEYDALVVCVSLLLPLVLV